MFFAVQAKLQMVFQPGFRVRVPSGIQLVQQKVI